MFHAAEPPIHIGNRVWIGAGAIIKRGVPAKVIKKIENVRPIEKK